VPLATQTQHAEQVGGLADGQGEVVEVEVTAQLHDGSAKQLGPQGRSSASRMMASLAGLGAAAPR
jgi:hypothetical protein